MIDVQAYITNFFKERCLSIFKDFLPPKYIPTIQKNSFGDSEFTTPCATQIFNMCSKKVNWPYKEAKDVAEEVIKDFKDEKQIINNVKITIQTTPSQKKDKKKEKVLPTNIYIDIYLNTKWEEETGMNILKNGIHLVS